MIFYVYFFVFIIIVIFRKMSGTNEKMLFEYFLGILGQIKVFHWSTMSYSTHKALDDLHKNLSDMVDELIEVYIGKFNKQPIEVFSISMEASSNTSNLIQYLEEQRENIRNIRTKTFKSSSEIQNICDSMMSSISNTIYLCKLK